MKILQIISRFDFGGAENYVRELSNELAEKGHELLIISKKGRQTKLLHPKVIHIPLSRYQHWMIVKIPLFIYFIKKYHIDVIHAHQRLPILTASIASFITRTPLVVTVHGRVRHDLKSAITRKIPRKFIFVSQQVLKVSKHYERLKSRSVVIPNGVTQQKNLPVRIPFQIGYLSRIDSKHYLVIQELLKILPKMNQHFPGIQLVIFGEGPKTGSLKSSIEEVNKLMGYPSVVWFGFLEDFSELTQAPELFLGVGRVAIEAAIQGLSVITVNQKRLGSIVQPENYEFYKQNNFVNINGEPPTEDQLFNEIFSFFQERDTFNQRANQLRAQISKDFEWKNISLQIEEIYKNEIKIATCNTANGY